VANEHDEVEGFNTRRLIGATSLSVEELVAAVHARGGLALASHIDREGYSLIAQLGFIPPDLPLDGVEISRRLSLPEARARFPQYAHLPFVSSSDAHDLDTLGLRPTWIRAAAAELDEVALALAGRAGRAVLEEGPDG
jgi:hypothetical protein